MLQIGDKAPHFELNDETGEKRSLDEFNGKKVVLYFYPKDDTPGCTTEAKDFTAKIDEFKAKNTVIIGVSKDSIDDHQKFCNKYGLKVTLLSDPDIKAIEAYGAWQEKNNYGKKYMGIQRCTFLINEEGKIEKIWPKVRVNGHVDAVLEAITD